MFELYRIYGLAPVIHENLRPPNPTPTLATAGKKSNPKQRYVAALFSFSVQSLKGPSFVTTATTDRKLRRTMPEAEGREASLGTND